MEDFSKQKILWGEISDRTKFCLDLNGVFVPEATTFLMTGVHLQYLLCVLNSSLSEYLFSKIGTTTGVGTVRWKKYKLENIIVPSWSIEREKLVLPLFDEIRKHGQSKEYLVNNIIFSICNLTKDEIKYINSIIN